MAHNKPQLARTLISMLGSKNQTQITPMVSFVDIGLIWNSRRQITVKFKQKKSAHRQQLTWLTVSLATLWLLLSGMFKPLLLILGVLSIALVCFLTIKMSVLLHRGQPLYFRVSQVIPYCAWLIVEILKSNVTVVKQIFNPKLPIDPVLKAIPSEQNTEVGRVTYANSITLTPGTVAINISANGDILVHALNKASMDELEAGNMAQRVNKLEPVLLPENKAKGEPQ